MEDRMEGVEGNLLVELRQRVVHKFSDFMTRVAEFEELVAVGSRLLTGFQQALEFLRRPPINKTSDLVEKIVKSNETARVKSYVEAGSINSHDGAQNCSHANLDCENIGIKEETASTHAPHLQKLEVTDYAAMMGVTFSMVKQDYQMQERIVSSLNLKLSSGELESYCLMWSASFHKRRGHASSLEAPSLILKVPLWPKDLSPLEIDS